MKVIPVLLLIIFLAAAIVPAANAQEAFRGVASRGVSAVAVGDSGRILFAWPAPHNLAWNSADFFLTNTLRGVTTDADDYVAAGDGGTIARSNDAEGYGTDWVVEVSNVEVDLFGICRASTRVAAVGDSGVIVHRNQEGGLWSVVSPEASPTNKPLRAVAGNPTYSVAVGDSGTVLRGISASMVTWTKVDEIPTSVDLRGVDVGPGQDPGRFWAVGEEGTIIRSYPDALTWELLSSPVSSDLNAVAFSPFIQPGHYVGIAVGDGGTIIYSSGGDEWSVVDSNVTVDLYGVAYTGSGAGGGFVAVGEANTILWSQLGIVWQDAEVAVEEATLGSIRSSWRSTTKPR